MNIRIIISGLFLRRSAWSVNIKGLNIDDLRDQPECGLNDWLYLAEKQLSGYNAPIDIVGHSFGGYLAQCLAAKLGNKVRHLWLLSALTSKGGSALESYQDSMQHLLFDICKLDMSSGKIILHQPQNFIHLLGQPTELALSEPVQLMIDLPPPEITQLSCPISYIITECDRLTPPQQQYRFARILNAREITYPGGHVTLLKDALWLNNQFLRL
ncbi:alpha/beta fold hydrolase [Xenorhabdus sp. PR6a]|uniref:alpha/beta fold hydrolase n=1 Tax=Xenorhabdus sp. PR6a TaxID=3025877 RepID=UPI0023592879|nr:alpha/beta fold hydrolase [Xenorhabdus sp. PR6a]MDC9581609.1 alpha/beta fold hydrolase [Xenorhabdus sp. PR6a]